MTLLLPGIELTSGAEISACKLYRYRLWRTWDSSKPPLVVCMLNPSTAGATQDDPTVRRCIGFAKAWGYGGLIVINMYAFRATDPKELRNASDPVGPHNDRVITEISREYGEVMIAWGTHLAAQARANHTLSLLSNARISCLGRTKHGHPRHPLYVSSKQQLEVF